MAKSIKSIADLQHDPQNANKGSERGRKAVDDSLTKYGAGRSIVVDQNGVVIGGNKTLEAARAAGIEVEVIRTKGDKLVVVQREDLDLLKDHKARKLAYADNRAGELGLDWDLDQIKQDLDAGLMLDDLFSLDELSDLGVDLPTVDPPEAPEAQMDAAEELQAKWKVQRGDVWQIGEHLLMCGDCRESIPYQGVALVLTDPPYGVSYVGNKGMKIENDDLSEDDLREFIRAVFDNLEASCKPGAYWFVTVPAGPLNLVFSNDLHCRGILRQQMVWVKDQMVMGRSEYHYKHEPILFGWTKGDRHQNKDRKKTSVFEVPRPKVNREHPTMKPVELFERPIETHTNPGDIVTDPFLGSGTTMVAAERLGRKCYGMEIEPKYCAVILERMQQMGLEPELVENANQAAS